MEQIYTGTLGDNNKQHKHKAKYNYIAVIDLGSESMSAFFGKTDRTMFFQIDLQDEDNIKRWTGWDTDINFLLDNNGNKSFRLRNKIVVNKKRGDYIKDKSKHAKKDFNNGYYNNSIFEIYQLKKDFKDTYLCNPKVIYAKGIKKILPIITDSSGRSVNIEPAEYLKHLTAQIVNNLILNDKRIKNIPTTDIKLVITVPNVYSLTHAKELVDFLSTHTDYAEIDYVYESDAVVYASIVKNYHYFNDTNKKYLENKFKNINSLLNKKQPVNIISHDIGKGTSDLSFFQIYPENLDRYSINIKARTGLTKAGNALDYIFVNFMEDYILKPYYKSENIDFELAISVTENRNREKIQNEINSNIQEIIYFLKKNIEKKKWWFWNKYMIPSNFYNQIKLYPNDDNINLNSDADKFKYALKKACEKIIEGSNSLRKFEDKIKDDDGNFNDTGKELIKKLYYSFIEGLFYGNKLRNKDLIKSIDNYIEALGNNLPTILKHNAKELSSVEQNQTFTLNNDNTFVIISGQASQFKPLRKKLIQRYGSLFSISEDKIILLENTISKDICAIGGFVQEQVKNQFNLVNPDDLLADYYLINTAGVDRNPRLDYIKLNQGKMIKVEKAGNPDLFLYSIINYNDDDITEIVKIDSDENETKNLDIEDFKSFIRGFTNNGIYTIKYDKQKTCFVINGNVVELGNKPQTNDHIYTNTWPEILK